MLVLAPLVILMVALWRLWEPDHVPSFRLVLLAMVTQLGVIVYYLINHAPLLSLFCGGFAGVTLIFMLHKVVKAEQIQRRIEEHQRRFGAED